MSGDPIHPRAKEVPLALDGVSTDGDGLRQMAVTIRVMATDYKHVWMTDPAEQIASIRKGVRASEAGWLIRCFNADTGQVARVLRIAPRTLERRAANRQRLTPDQSERVVRLGAVYRAAVATLGDEVAAVSWFKKPRAELGGDTPLLHCDTEVGRQEVERVLDRISEGIFG